MAPLRQPATVQRWSGPFRLFVSALVSAHLFVVVVAPWSSPPPSSELSRRCAALVLPYMKCMSLDNGYRFFAPDPGPSHLLRYEVLHGDELVAAGIYPDRAHHFPRLLYHRFFMVAETMASQMPPPLSPSELEELSPPDRFLYGQAVARAGLLQRSIARHLLHRHPDADRVRLFLQTHRIPSPLEVLQGMALTDASLTRESPLIDFTRELPAP